MPWLRLASPARQTWQVSANRTCLSELWVGKDPGPKRSRGGGKKIVEILSSFYLRWHRERVGFPFVACHSCAREAKVRGIWDIFKETARLIFPLKSHHTKGKRTLNKYSKVAKSAASVGLPYSSPLDSSLLKSSHCLPASGMEALESPFRTPKATPTTS